MREDRSLCNSAIAKRHLTLHARGTILADQSLFDVTSWADDVSRESRNGICSCLAGMMICNSIFKFS